jgi:hypothetical protein
MTQFLANIENESTHKRHDEVWPRVARDGGRVACSRSACIIDSTMITIYSPANQQAHACHLWHEAMVSVASRISTGRVALDHVSDADVFTFEFTFTFTFTFGFTFEV